MSDTKRQPPLGGCVLKPVWPLVSVTPLPSRL